MVRLLQPLRFVAILFSIGVYLIHMSFVFLLVRRRWSRLRLSNRILSYYSAFALWVLKITVRPFGAADACSKGPGLFVGNHLSYIDVLVMTKVLPLGFVTSVEIRETPGLGLICEMAGCLFVERRNRGNIRAEVAELSEGLRHGLNVAIFPEATSSNGESLLRFRRPLYMSAVAAEKPVIPFCLNYRTVGGDPINKLNRDKIFWYGDMDFVPHLWALAGADGVTVDVHFLDPVATSASDDPATLAELTQSAVAKVFTPVQ